ncbi:MAG: nucleoside triphosphate pyrophosphohydrolase [Syntrophaceae bacterium]
MQEFDQLVAIIERLRAPGGCPWDAEQDHQSLAPHAIEEAYELLDAINDHDVEHLREELGDLLLQVVLHGVIAQETGEFTLPEVIEGLIEKLIHRHPHVFGETKVGSAEEVTHNWEKLKRKEKGKRTRQTIFDGIPASLPALLSARKIQSAAKRAGHDWGDNHDLLARLRRSVDNLAAELKTPQTDQALQTVGELLFWTVALARDMDIDSESALRVKNAEVKAELSS